MRDALHQQHYTPVLFDFDKPASRDLTETVNTLAHLARFIVVDLTDPSSAPHEVATIIPQTIVPVLPLLWQGPMGDGTGRENHEYAMFQDLRRRSQAPYAMMQSSHMREEPLTMEELPIERVLSPENTMPLSLEEANQLAHGDVLEQALSTFLQTDQPEPFFAVVARFFGVSHLAPVVQDYLKATKQVQGIKGPFHLSGLAESLHARGTWKEWMTDTWGDGVFPGIYIGYETLGTEFLLLLSTGSLISLHHDALPELVSELEEEAHSREQFLEALVARGSGWSLPHLIQLQIGLWNWGMRWNTLKDDQSLEQVQSLVCALQQWSAAELEEALTEPKMEFLRSYCKR